MQYTFKPLSNFSIRSDFMQPLSRNEYEERSSVVRPGVKPTPDLSASKALGGLDKVDISSSAGRESMLNSLRSKFGAGSNASLVGSLSPPNMSFGSGLYAGVGQLPSYQIKSLISRYF